MSAPFDAAARGPRARKARSSRRSSRRWKSLVYVVPPQTRVVRGATAPGHRDDARAGRYPSGGRMTTVTTSLERRFGTFDGLRVRYADTGGSAGQTLLLTSPWPESVYAFARVWPRLAGHARLYAIDLPGFGASERGEDLLSSRAMGGFLAEVIVEAGLETPYIV